jgi:hypothetical protein
MLYLRAVRANGSNASRKGSAHLRCELIYSSAWKGFFHEGRGDGVLRSWVLSPKAGYTSGVLVCPEREVEEVPPVDQRRRRFE